MEVFVLNESRRKQISDEQNNKILSKDTISITDFLFCLRLQCDSTWHLKNFGLCSLRIFVCVKLEFLRYCIGTFVLITVF